MKAARGSRRSRRPKAPVTDYSLARRMLLEHYRKGTATIHDLCDAHPELMRAARNIGKSLDRPCPVCQKDRLRVVRYVFGDQLGRFSGRPVYPEGWARELAEDHDEFRCYAVEVCISCSWNHLLAIYLMGRRYSSSGRLSSAAATT